MMEAGDKQEGAAGSKMRFMSLMPGPCPLCWLSRETFQDAGIASGK